MPDLKMLILAGAAIAIPFAIVHGLPLMPALRTLDEPAAADGSRFDPSPLVFERREAGPVPKRHPLIANVQIIDYDGDGKNDILACDVRHGSIVLARRDDRGQWSETVLAEDIAAPAHATVVDLDLDGDQDLIVAVLGNISPSDQVIGRLLWFEQTSGGLIRHVLLDGVRRVADCQAGDLDGDGDIDLSVAVFGYARGQVLWLENIGEGRFVDHELLAAPGTIHVPLADFDGDGNLDIAAIVSQDEEE